MTMGYERILFIDTPDNSLECAICQEIICDPVSGVTCGHSFCKSCMKKWTAEQKKCPTCRKKLSPIDGSDDDDDDEDSDTDSDDESTISGDSLASTRTTPIGTFNNIALSRLIDNLQVSCSNKRTVTSTVATPPPDQRLEESNNAITDSISRSDSNTVGTPRSTATDGSVARLPPTTPAKRVCTASSSSPCPSDNSLSTAAVTSTEDNSSATATETTTTTATVEGGTTVSTTVTTSTNNDITDDGILCCKWTGSLSDYKNKHVNECPYEKVTCFVPGCNYQCLRCDLDKHMTSTGVSLVTHVKYMMEEQTSKTQDQFEKQTNQMKETIQDQVLKKMDDDQVHRCIVQFCRLWKYRRPKPFVDTHENKDGGFVVYRAFNCEAGKFARSLLVGIPSPRKGSQSWPFVSKRARFPVLITWENGWSKPPSCRFPENCGTFCGVCWDGGDVYSYRVKDIWYPDMSILNILLMLQELVGHSDNASSLAEMMNEYPISADLLTVLGKFDPSIDGGGDDDDYDWRMVGENPSETKSCFSLFSPFQQQQQPRYELAEFIDSEWA